MLALIAALILVAILFAFGAAVHLLLWIALFFLIVWALGLLVHSGGRRWYYW